MQLLNEDYLKVLKFLELYDKEMFTQQTLIDSGLTYHAKVSYVLNDLFEWGIILEMAIEGMGRVRLYKFNKYSEIYKQIIDLRDSTVKRFVDV